MKIITSNLHQRVFFVIMACVMIQLSCKQTEKASGLAHLLNDSIYAWEKSKSSYAGQYNSYLTATTRDTSIHTKKSLQHTYYPWKANLSKAQADSFLLYLERNLSTDRDYKSSFGELPSIGTAYTPSEVNYNMADLLSCRLVNYDLTNNKAEKIMIEEDEVSINRNLGAISFSLPKWDLQGQKIRGKVTLEISIPYHIHKIELKPGDRTKTFDFGATKINVLEIENNVLHYSIQDDQDYQTQVLIDSCMSSTHHLSFPSYFYDKVRAKPNLSYPQFVADSTYFELNRKWKKDTRRVHITYFESCDPETIYLYGYRRDEVSKKLITITIDAEIR